MVAVEQTENELPAGTQVLRRYSIVGKLAQGGMAEVYLARQVGPAGYNKLVVIKRVRPHLANDSDFVGMFVNEARLAAMINHPNVVQIFDLGDEPRPAGSAVPGRPGQGAGQDWFLAMEYLDGRDMLQVGRACRSHNKAVPFDVTARIIADACAGLDHAHNLKGEGGKSLDLVHRDMSPENILITFEGQVKVVGFGIAKASDNLIKTQAGQIKGKLGYVAPEAILGKPVDARADVFAVGATLYLFLSGRPAFTGTNPMEIFERSLKPPTPPREVNPRVPEALDAICMKALAQDREKRYRSAGEVRIALDAYLQSTGRPLGAVQLSQFMRILFPADKDPVRQRIDKMLADAPVGAPIGLPLTSSQVSRSPSPVLAPAPSPLAAPAPILVDDDDKTNIVGPKGNEMSVPDPITLQTQRSSSATAAVSGSGMPARPVPNKSAGPAHLRSMGVQKDVARDLASKPSGRPVDVEMTNEDLDLRTLALAQAARSEQARSEQARSEQARAEQARLDQVATVQTNKPALAALPSVDVAEMDEISAAVAEDDDLEIDMGATLPKSAPAVPAPSATEARRFSATSMDVAAAAFDISIATQNGDIDLPPPPFEASGRVQRPAASGNAPPPSFSPAPSSPPPAFATEVPAAAPPPSFLPQSQAGQQYGQGAPPYDIAPPDMASLGVAGAGPGSPAGPGLGIKLAMLAFGAVSGLIVLLVILFVTGSLARITGA